MEAWEDISHEDRDVWWQFSGQFRFSPSVHMFPGFAEPSPSVTYFIGHVYSDHYVRFVSDLSTRMLAAFRRCVPPDGWLYVLDMQHPSYRFRPHAPFDHEDERNWPVPVLPNGDYYIFLADDLRFGVIGHPWEQTMCIYGAELLASIESSLPLLFDTVVREDGQQVRALVHGIFDFEGNEVVQMNAVGPRGLPLAEFLRQLETSGYDFPGGHATLFHVICTEDIENE